MGEETERIRRAITPGTNVQVPLKMVVTAIIAVLCAGVYAGKWMSDIESQMKTNHAQMLTQVELLRSSVSDLERANLNLRITLLEQQLKDAKKMALFDVAARLERLLGRGPKAKE